MACFSSCSFLLNYANPDFIFPFHWTFSHSRIDNVTPARAAWQLVTGIERAFEWTDIQTCVKESAEMKFHGPVGQKLYNTYGVTLDAGLVAVRPNGYIRLLISLANFSQADNYSSACLVRAMDCPIVLRKEGRTQTLYKSVPQMPYTYHTSKVVFGVCERVFGRQIRGRR
ncbi:uncharacterized protein EAF02_011312 [Botrytis sinoallii]|uniref:uncharacterized protein n=1 Tax=Botrytis sinoallii TaxID=1463999 RepID=UPI0019028030|nr:uncharacterized protein EAF02_011312 [Botrytis sinoallii]KAF7857079.1 hypothetical protein EAF02_011312 [Botrytis sinoallii]